MFTSKEVIMPDNKLSCRSGSSKHLSTAQIIKKLARRRRQEAGLTIRDQRRLFWQGLYKTLERK